jgi:hypothetical protein
LVGRESTARAPGLQGRSGGALGPTTRDFTAEAAEDAENGSKQGNGRKARGDPDSKAQEGSPFSAFSAISAVKK